MCLFAYNNLAFNYNILISGYKAHLCIFGVYIAYVGAIGVFFDEFIINKV